MNKLLSDYMNLHRIPEEGFKEIKTQEYILQSLCDINCKVYILNPTGLLVFFDYGSTDTIAFRCEMDGLNIKESNDFVYKSLHDGYMHACGHDGHMAIMLSFARTLDKIKCPRNVCLIFQPSEEIYGGALHIINSEEYKKLNVIEVYGIHLWPGIKKGVIASRGNTLMASSTEIDINIIGKNAHIANYEKGIDAIRAASLLITSVNNDEDVIFNCGKITSNGARNIICNDVLLECSLRTFYKIKRKKFLKSLNEEAKSISNLTNTNIYITSNKLIPEVKNSVFLFEKHRHLIDEVVSPVYQAEDFSFYSTNCKTLFMFLGVGSVNPLHSSDFNFELDVLEKGLKIYTSIATTR